MIYFTHMDVTTAQLYDLLVEKGFEKSRVREALSEIASKDEVGEIAATGFDRVRADFRNELTKHELKLYRAMLIQTGAIAAIVLGMLQFAL